VFVRATHLTSPVADFQHQYTLGGGPGPRPGPLARLKATLVMAALVAVGAAILAGIVAISLVLLPFALLTVLVGWLVIRHRVRRALRAMEDPPEDTTGRENVRVREPAQGDPF
jgi:Flp pilus assembly protein TadB